MDCYIIADMEGGAEMNVIIRNGMSIPEQIALMNDDARYDVADTDAESIDMPAIRDIKSQKALPKVPKVFLSNDCAFNCAYCGCRNTTDKRRYCINPAELAKMAVLQAEENKRGIFITSAIHKNANYTQELIIETLKSVRGDYGFKGYVHAKVMPGADPLLIAQAGLYADRLSVNIEVARSEGYAMIAKQKNKNNILTPMKQISDMISSSAGEKSRRKAKFATSQTTQLMAGSTNEDDRTILTLSKALYKKYNLKRVYYTPFNLKEPAKGYDIAPVATPRWRMYRLYQADRLMELYGFTPDEITPEGASNLEFELDPKASWALRNLDIFPVELNAADYEKLIRVPGIGTVYARKILKAREYCNITFDVLKKIGVPMKKCKYFITCGGKYSGGVNYEADKMRKILSADSPGEMYYAEQTSLDILD